MKIKEIAQAMQGNVVWCLNRWFARTVTTCVNVAGCTFKDGEKRLATPRELYKCRTFRIEKVPNKAGRQDDSVGK